MQLTFTRPIVFFDLETTGTDVQKDRIVQISLIKLYPDKKEETLSYLINPEMSIPVGATAIHGISNADVKDEPNFKIRSNEIFIFLKGCDIGGYNIHNFDLPLLRNEFIRAGINYEIEGISIIDSMVIYKKKERRDLTAAYKFYCNKNLENAHNAEADIRATMEVFLAQVEKYNDIGSNLEEISAFSSFNDSRPADINGKFLYNKNNELIFNFGSHKGERVIDNADYAKWMLTRDFPADTVALIKKIFGLP